MDALENLQQYRDLGYDCNDIAEKLVELADLDDKQICNKLLDALYWLKAAAQNPYNKDSFRVMFNILLAITRKKN